MVWRTMAVPEDGHEPAVPAAQGRRYVRAGFWAEGGGCEVAWPGGWALLEPEHAKILARGPVGVPALARALCAPMQARVVSVRVAAGDAVATGEVLVVLEAMKMEHSLRSDRDGRIAEVAVTEGALVGHRAELVVFEAQDG